ncbi:MAG: winged helix-turn-helix domain-containing protein [Myxococcales bacterium]|nr:winged helix-turn-helix domain-containing protein [Myxococcales bacterium]
MGDGVDNGDGLTLDECLRAGMYWFGRSDLQAAESWWTKALELAPGNVRAEECLRLLRQTSTTGFKSSSWAESSGPTRSPFINPEAPEVARRPYLEVDPNQPRHIVTVRGSGYRFDP